VERKRRKSTSGREGSACALPQLLKGGAEVILGGKKKTDAERKGGVRPNRGRERGRGRCDRSNYLQRELVQPEQEEENYWKGENGCKRGHRRRKKEERVLKKGVNGLKRGKKMTGRGKGDTKAWLDSPHRRRRGETHIWLGREEDPGKKIATNGEKKKLTQA